MGNTGKSTSKHPPGWVEVVKVEIVFFILQIFTDVHTKLHNAYHIEKLILGVFIFGVLSSSSQFIQFISRSRI